MDFESLGELPPAKQFVITTKVRPKIGTKNGYLAAKIARRIVGCRKEIDAPSGAECL